MKERPILFSAPMVRAVRNDSKTQTRRVVNRLTGFGPITEFNRSDTHGYVWTFRDRAMRWHDIDHRRLIECSPYGAGGDALWVRETWAQNWHQLSDDHMDRSYVYRADGETRAQDNGTDLPWRPSIHMPRRVSRIDLEVTGMRVERLQDISQVDARAEGAPPSHPSIDQISRQFGYEDFSRSWYAQLWEQINGSGSWAANPWVWVVEFSRVIT